MKIYADENIERSIVEGLRRRKIEVFSARELGYLGKSDEFHINKASEMKAVMLTHDVDFLKIASSKDVTHNGIIFSHPKNVSIGQCIRGVELIARVLTDKNMMDHIEFL
jgi:predicted nuclease of predicted toxin-antitoxin system